MGNRARSPQSLDVFGHTDVGQSRSINEDSYLCRQLPGGRGTLLAVADGMGGHVGGQIASQLALDTLAEAVEASCAAAAGGLAGGEALRRGFADANRAVHAQARSKPQLAGMGTTLVAALVLGGRATLGNVGDSRGYLLRRGELRQITRDHSWLAERRREGALSADELEASPFRNSITRCIGLEAEVEVDLFELALEEEDRLLLCTDGLYQGLSDEELRRLLTSGGAESSCRQLVGEANQSDGSDNITGVVGHVAGVAGRAARGSDTVPFGLDVLAPAPGADGAPR